MMTLNINLLASVKMDKDLCNTETSTYFGNVINKDGRTDIQYMTTQNLPALHGINITVWGGELESDGTRPISDSSGYNLYPSRCCLSNVHHHLKKTQSRLKCPLHGYKCHHKTAVWWTPGGELKCGHPKTTWWRTVEDGLREINLSWAPDSEWSGTGRSGGMLSLFQMSKGLEGSM